MALAVLILFLCEVGEDLVSYSLERLNFRVLPKQRHITEAELEMMAAAQLRVSSICEPERAVSMVPNSTPAWSSNLDHLGSLGDFWGLCHTVTAERFHKGTSGSVLEITRQLCIRIW